MAIERDGDKAALERLAFLRRHLPSHGTHGEEMFNAFDTIKAALTARSHGTASTRVLTALDKLLRHCEINPEGETDFEIDVKEARLALAEAMQARPSSIAAPVADDEVLAFVREQLDNCHKLAATKTGIDQIGWLDDARLHSAILTRLSATASASATPIFFAPIQCDAPSQNMTLTLGGPTTAWYCHGCGASNLEPKCKYRKSVATDGGAAYEERNDALNQLSGPGIRKE